MADVVAMPQGPFRDWLALDPSRSFRDDPREGCGPCEDCGQTSAWVGYGGLCGWCFRDATALDVNVFE